jgi:hypothetical protein
MRGDSRCGVVEKGVATPYISREVVFSKRVEQHTALAVDDRFRFAFPNQPNDCI